MIQPHDSLIVQTMTRLLVPLVQLFAVYVLFFGQHSPGGGFVGGVMLAASLILAVLVFGPDGPPSALARKAVYGDGLGLLVFAGVGGLCLIGGGEFLNYTSLPLAGLEPDARRSLGIVLTQIGVALDVAVTGVSIVFSLALVSEEEHSDA